MNNRKNIYVGVYKFKLNKTKKKLKKENIFFSSKLYFIIDRHKKTKDLL